MLCSPQQRNVKSECGEMDNIFWYVEAGQVWSLGEYHQATLPGEFIGARHRYFMSYGIRNDFGVSFTFVAQQSWISLLSELGYEGDSDESEIEFRFCFCTHEEQENENDRQKCPDTSKAKKSINAVFSSIQIRTCHKSTSFDDKSATWIQIYVLQNYYVYLLLQLNGFSWLKWNVGFCATQLTLFSVRNHV